MSYICVVKVFTLLVVRIAFSVLPDWFYVGNSVLGAIFYVVRKGIPVLLKCQHKSGVFDRYFGLKLSPSPSLLEVAIDVNQYCGDYS